MTVERRDTLSVPDKLVLAAYELEEGGQRPFSAEDLVVSAWRKFPDTFGLAGYRAEDGQLLYPDSNRVFAEVMGSKPIRKRGLLRKVGRKMYQLTEAGREYAGTLSRRPAESVAEKAALARGLVAEPLRRLLSSRAVEKFKNGRISDITFYDACAFWGISPSSSAIQLKGQVANFEKIVKAAQDVARDRATTFEHGGRAFTTEDLGILLQVHEHLLQSFRQEIDIIRMRTDERR